MCVCVRACVRVCLCVSGWMGVGMGVGVKRCSVCPLSVRLCVFVCLYAHEYVHALTRVCTGEPVYENACLPSFAQIII